MVGFASVHNNCPRILQWILGPCILCFHFSNALPFNPLLSDKPLVRQADDPNPDFHDKHFLTPLDFENALRTPEKRPTEDDLKAMQLPNLFEGDITGFAVNERIQYDIGDVLKYPQNSALNLVTFPDKLWPHGRIPYMLEDLLNEYERLVVAQAFEEYKTKTCIRFVPKDETDYDYVYIRKNRDTGCSSYVGRAGGNQTVSLEIDKCFSKGIVAHELMHVLGFFHEHSRTDRDKYIKVVDDNISSGMLRNFEKYPHKVMDTMDMPYDYGSVMHYHKLAFSRNGKPTIMPYDTNAEIGQRYRLSEIDASKVNKLYKCETFQPKENVNVVDRLLTTTTTVAPITTVDKNKVDKGKEDVDRNWNYMLISKGLCSDFNDHCKMWADIGHCKWSEKYMAHYCKKSCDLCITGILNRLETITEPPIRNCVDQNLFCAYWAKIGECDNETKFMKTYCKRACGMCS